MIGTLRAIAQVEEKRRARKSNNRDGKTMNKSRHFVEQVSERVIVLLQDVQARIAMLEAQPVAPEQEADHEGEIEALKQMAEQLGAVTLIERRK